MNNTLQPLTAEEQRMAEEHFHLVPEFLARKRLDPGEFYDVVIFGFLQAVQRECRREGASEVKNFFGLVETCMNRAFQMELRHKYAEKRTGDRLGLSFDGIPRTPDEDEIVLHDLVGDARQNTQAQVEAKDLTKRVLAVATPREREVIDLICLGYGTGEIAKILNIAYNTVVHITYNFRRKAKAVRDDQPVIRCPQWARDKERVQARNAAYRQTHREEIRERQRIYNRAYRAAHPEKVRAKQRAYYAAHREEINAKDRARHAAKRAAEKQAKEQEKRRPRCSEHQGRQTVATSI